MTNHFTSWDDLPLFISIDQVAHILGISRSGAYAIAHSNGFPLTKLGKRMVVETNKLKKWLDDQCKDK